MHNIEREGVVKPGSGQHSTAKCTNWEREREKRSNARGDEVNPTDLHNNFLTWFQLILLYRYES